MSWLTSVDDLRNLLADNSTNPDKLFWRKRALGECNGVNTTFKTLEYRRITDFTTALTPEGVYLNGVLLALVSIATDVPMVGEFSLVVPPVDGDVVESTYYTFWFLDTELTQFLSDASNWIGYGPDQTTIPDGLQPSALKYAAADAYQKLAMRWTSTQAATYKLDDAPDHDQMKMMNPYLAISNQLRKEARDIRDDVYKNRKGQALAPLFGNNTGRVADVEGRR